jgi:hypothetical protein
LGTSRPAVNHGYRAGDAGMIGVMSAEDFDRIFTKSTVLELNDDSAVDKLLGIDIDLDYN